MKTDCVAMILAGGQGTRLGRLTKKVAKPAVSFGGKYKIIDFTLSNCMHSGIDIVAVLTQYQPQELNAYIGNGRPWDLDRNSGGVFILPPHIKGEKAEFYKGTANAVYQNMEFADQFNPSYILVLSGDHVYKMDYNKMIEQHRKTGAEVTISVIGVPLSEAGRFGIVKTDDDGRIIEFEEKPRYPRSNLASMGVYIFNREKLREYLEDDENDPDSSNDFGKDVLPLMIRNREKVYAYMFDGYWRDVGTTQSLWAANMDLIQNPPKFDLYDMEWSICSRYFPEPPQYISESANVCGSIISEGCKIYGTVKNSIVSTGAYVGEGCVIEDSVILPEAKITDGAVITKAVIGLGEVISGQHIIGTDDIALICGNPE